MFDRRRAAGDVVPGGGFLDAHVMGDAQPLLLRFVEDGHQDVAIEAGELEAVGALGLGCAYAFAGLFRRARAARPQVGVHARRHRVARTLGGAQRKQSADRVRAHLAEGRDARGQPELERVFVGLRVARAAALEMRVRVDEARQHELARGVDLRVGLHAARIAAAQRDRVEPGDLGDCVADDEDVGGTARGRAVAVDDRRVADGQRPGADVVLGGGAALRIERERGGEEAGEQRGGQGASEGAGGSHVAGSPREWRVSEGYARGGGTATLLTRRAVRACGYETSKETSASEWTPSVIAKGIRTRRASATRSNPSCLPRADTRGAAQSAIRIGFSSPMRRPCGERRACQRSQSVCRCSQKSALIPSTWASLSAVSAVTPRLPRTISFKRGKDTPSRWAKADCETPIGSRNSLSSISPGWVGGRCVGSTRRTSAARPRGALVVVSDFDLRGIAVLPAKADAVLSVDPDAVLAEPVALQAFQPIPWGNPEVIQSIDPMQLVELSPRDRPNRGRTAPTCSRRVAAVEDVFGAGIRE